MYSEIYSISGNIKNQFLKFTKRSASIPQLPPSANHAWITTRGGGRIRSKDYLQYIAASRVHAHNAFRGWNPKGPLAMVLELHSPRFVTKKGLPSLSMDLDNRIKTVLDMLHGNRKTPGVINCDDALYWNINAFKLPCMDMEMTVVHIYDLGSPI